MADTMGRPDAGLRGLDHCTPIRRRISAIAACDELTIRRQVEIAAMAVPPEAIAHPPGAVGNTLRGCLPAVPPYTVPRLLLCDNGQSRHP